MRLYQGKWGELTFASIAVAFEEYVLSERVAYTVTWSKNTIRKSSLYCSFNQEYILSERVAYTVTWFKNTIRKSSLYCSIVEEYILYIRAVYTEELFKNTYYQKE